MAWDRKKLKLKKISQEFCKKYDLLISATLIVKGYLDSGQYDKTEHNNRGSHADTNKPSWPGRNMEQYLDMSQSTHYWIQTNLSKLQTFSDQMLTIFR